VPSDAIVVLGAGIFPEGELSEPSLKRAIRGIELYHQGLAPRLVLLGGPREIGMPTEAAVRRAMARTLQVPVDALIVVEDDAGNTRGEAMLVRDLLPGSGPIILVTETQHLLRAVPLFENAGFQVHPVPADSYSIDPDGPEGRLRLLARIVQEQAARIYYRLAGYL
jgi:uncharacterized SAM-binding protein YcdF (DUF218 family)